jgi:hypothetical protein
MANMTKSKKHTLLFEQDYDFDMIGICSHHNDYRLAWGINERLNIQLTKAEEDYIAVNKKGVRVSEHSLYEFKDEDCLTEYYLVKNKNQGKLLVPEKPSIDYFLFLFENHLIDPDELTQQLREIPSVLGTFLFNPEEIQSTENIVFN